MKHKQTYIKQHIQTAINEIEKNISEKFDIDKIINVSFTEHSQLYRDFYNLTGHPVKEYIRKRRMSKALALIKHSDTDLSVIANVCGYATQQAFCKSVKAMIGQTPLEYKKSENYYYFPAYNDTQRYQVSVLSETIPQITKLKYYSNESDKIENIAIETLFDVFPDYKGRIFGRNGKQAGDTFCYELYIETIFPKDCEQINEKFKICEEIPCQTYKYAKVPVMNNYEQIRDAWDYLYTDWLNTSMFEKAGRPYFEEYIHKDGKVKKLILYLPVQRRADYDKITINSNETMMFLTAKSSNENTASKTVINYLEQYEPDILRNSKVFFRKREETNENKYICGVKLKHKLDILNSKQLEILIAEGEFVVLECSCYNKSSIFEDRLKSWINDNRFETEGECFTTYDVTDGFDDKHVMTKIYIKLKNGKNG